jgi:hypothetical protein
MDYENKLNIMKDLNDIDLKAFMENDSEIEIENTLKYSAFNGYTKIVKNILEYKKFSFDIMYDLVVYSAGKNHPETLKVILKNIDDLYKYNFNEALTYSLVCGNERCIKILIPISDLDYLDKKSYEAMKKNGTENCLRFF